MTNHNQSPAPLSETAQRRRSRRNRHTRTNATPASSKKKNTNPNVQQVDKTIAAGHPDSEEAKVVECERVFSSTGIYPP